MNTLANGIRAFHVLLTGLWLGAGAFALLLQTLIPETLGSEHLAHTVLFGARTQLDYFGLMAGPIILLTLPAGWSSFGVPLRFRSLLALGGTLTAGFSGQYLQPRLLEVMNALGRPLEDLPLQDPWLLQYRDLADVSFGLLVLQVAVAFLLTFLAVIHSQPRQQFGIQV